jgi:predicted GTPase
VVVINKVDTADQANIHTVQQNIRKVNQKAMIVKGASPIFVDDPAAIKGKRVLVVEDGPTLTHGEMAYGAPRTAVTMDFREDRVTVSYDDNYQIERVSCG